MNGIKTSNLSVGYDHKVLLSNVELEVRPGQIVTLIGPNGAGKSTILKSLTRQLETLGGYIYLNGKDMNKMSGNEIAKSIAMVMTERIRPELLSCRDVIASGRYPYTGVFGILSKEDERKVEEAMMLLNVQELSERSFFAISDGQRQRVMLARAICQETGTLVLDEPTSFLDMRHKIDILQSIKRMAKEKNLAVIMSLHELDLAYKLSDLVVCVDSDGAVLSGTPEEILLPEVMKSLYKVEEEIFDPLTGILSMPKSKGNPKVFVIGGGGSALSTFYRLQRAQIPFATGIINENDVEYNIAKSIANEVITEAAFCPISEKTLERAKRRMDLCDSYICCLDSFGPLNEANRILADYAKSQGKNAWQK